MKGGAVVFSRAATGGRDDWQTPPDLFMVLDDEFHFTLDAAASPDSALCEHWYGPGSPFGEDALEQPWRPYTAFCNPPYSQVAAFIEKAATEAQRGRTAVLLVPSRTDTRWWHRYVWDVAANNWREGVEGRFLKGRVRFIDPAGKVAQSAPFPSVVLVFRPPQ